MAIKFPAYLLPILIPCGEPGYCPALVEDATNFPSIYSFTVLLSYVVVIVYILFTSIMLSSDWANAYVPLGAIRDATFREFLFTYWLRPLYGEDDVSLSTNITYDKESPLSVVNIFTLVSNVKPFGNAWFAVFVNTP